MEKRAGSTARWAFELLVLTSWALPVSAELNLTAQDDTRVCEDSDAKFRWNYSLKESEVRWTKLHFSGEYIFIGHRFNLTHAKSKKKYDGRYKMISLDRARCSFLLKNVTKADEGQYELCFSLESGDKLCAQGNLTVTGKKENALQYFPCGANCRSVRCGQNQETSVEWYVNGTKLQKTTPTIKHCGPVNDICCFLGASTKAVENIGKKRQVNPDRSYSLFKGK